MYKIVKEIKARKLLLMPLTKKKKKQNTIRIPISVSQNSTIYFFSRSFIELQRHYLLITLLYLMNLMNLYIKRRFKIIVKS
jgi:hypothetical protein